MDETTLRKECYMSQDRKTMFNIQQPITEQGVTESDISGSYAWPPGSFQKYTGAKGTQEILPPDNVYFEFDVRYNVIKNFTGPNLVFEVGLSKLEEIDKNHYVGNNQTGWSLYGHNDQLLGGISLKGRHIKNIIFKMKISDSTTGISNTLSLGVHLDTTALTMSIVDPGKTAILYTFEDVDYTQGLWPGFGVYNPDDVNVQIKVRTGHDVINVPLALIGVQ